MVLRFLTAQIQACLSPGWKRIKEEDNAFRFTHVMLEGGSIFCFLRLCAFLPASIHYSEAKLAAQVMDLSPETQSPFP